MNQLSINRVWTGRWMISLAIATTSAAQTAPPPTQPQSKSELAAGDYDSAQILTRGVEHLLSVQEGPEKAEWPYEGVYRVGGEIPIGYRVGGTAISAMALLQAPGYAADTSRQQAVARATKFILDAIKLPLMNPQYDGGYDVRGWGYTYGLTFLLRQESANAVPEGMSAAVHDCINWLVNAIQQTEIHKVGGWNYARASGADAVSPPASFMTAPTLQALFQAKAQGYAVDAEVVSRALDSLELARTPAGSITYSGVEGKTSHEAVPGSVGRMLVTEITLHLAGRSSVANIRGAIDAFIVHWEWLNKRRAQQGTHVRPYSIAPYYFYYAHYYAAQAIEVLPQQERAEYRRRIRELLMSVRLPDGTWNDRVFERSSNYGTAMAMMALMMPDAQTPAAWQP